MARPSKSDYLMGLAIAASSRSTCDRRRVGCVIADTSGHVVATGYNGSAPGSGHCDDVGHLYIDGRKGCARTIHAELNALAQAARHGRAVTGCRAFVTIHPCLVCAQALSSAGIFEVVYLSTYRALEDSMVQGVVPVSFVQLSAAEAWFSEAQRKLLDDAELPEKAS